mmetsp:Transcript_9235/g.16630  ORF Transcript_9235/g.16630 Transcript_9235/m.16630 type:complete len:187 (+) Transcript_9235:43-603(+)
MTEVRSVDALLHMSFDEAVAVCSPLRAYIKENDDPSALEAEFRRSWSPEASNELRAALNEIVGASEVDELLSLPFEEAWEQCEELRDYVETNGSDNPAALRDEFRRHWGPDAPEALREVLQELLAEDQDGNRNDMEEALEESSELASHQPTQRPLPLHLLPPHFSYRPVQPMQRPIPVPHGPVARL